jgi:hypothetical protein
MGPLVGRVPVSSLRKWEMTSWLQFRSALVKSPEWAYALPSCECNYTIFIKSLPRYFMLDVYL